MRQIPSSLTLSAKYCHPRSLPAGPYYLQALIVLSQLYSALMFANVNLIYIVKSEASTDAVIIGGGLESAISPSISSCASA